MRKLDHSNLQYLLDYTRVRGNRSISVQIQSLLLNINRGKVNTPSYSYPTGHKVNPFDTKPMAKIAVKMSIMRVVKFMSS